MLLSGRPNPFNQRGRKCVLWLRLITLSSRHKGVTSPILYPFLLRISEVSYVFGPASDAAFGLVPGGGVEPPRAEARRILSPLRLPVPPSRLWVAIQFSALLRLIRTGTAESR